MTAAVGPRVPRQGLRTEASLGTTLGRKPVLWLRKGWWLRGDRSERRTCGEIHPGWPGPHLDRTEDPSRAHSRGRTGSHCDFVGAGPGPGNLGSPRPRGEPS